MVHYMALPTVLHETVRQWQKHINHEIQEGIWPLTLPQDNILLLTESMDDSGIAQILAESVSKNIGLPVALPGETYLTLMRIQRTRAVLHLVRLYKRILLKYARQHPACADSVAVILKPVEKGVVVFEAYVKSDGRVNEKKVLECLKEKATSKLIGRYCDLVATRRETPIRFELDFCPPKIASEITGLSRPRISQLYNQNLITGFRAKRVVFVSVSEIQNYLQSRHRGGTRPADIPSVIRIQGQEYILATKASQYADIDYSAKWIAQLVREHKVAGLNAWQDGASGRVWVSLKSLRDYIKARPLHNKAGN